MEKNHRFILDKYLLKNIPGMVDLNVDGSGLYYDIFDETSNHLFHREIDRLKRNGVKGRHLLSYLKMFGRGNFSPLLRIVSNKKASETDYLKNIDEFLKLLNDGTVPKDIIKSYVNQYIDSTNIMSEIIEYKPAVYYGRMTPSYIKLFLKNGFDSDLSILYENKIEKDLNVGMNSLGLIDEGIGGIEGSSDSYEDFDIELTQGQKAADLLLSHGADMHHRPTELRKRNYGDKTIVNVPLRPNRQLYPYDHFSDIGYRLSLPDNDRMKSFNLHMMDQDRLQMEKRLPTTNFLRELETLKPEQKLKLALFLENTDIEGIEAMFDFIDKISEYHDTMNPFTMRDSTGKRTSVKYLSDKLRGGGRKITKKKQRGGRSKRRSRMRSRSTK
jgi:hypothetical protein